MTLQVMSTLELHVVNISVFAASALLTLVCLLHLQTSEPWFTLLSARLLVFDYLCFRWLWYHQEHAWRAVRGRAHVLWEFNVIRRTFLLFIWLNFGSSLLGFYRHSRFITFYGSSWLPTWISWCYWFMKFWWWIFKFQWIWIRFHKFSTSSKNEDMHGSCWLPVCFSSNLDVYRKYSNLIINLPLTKFLLLLSPAVLLGLSLVLIQSLRERQTPSQIGRSKHNDSDVLNYWEEQPCKWHKLRPPPSK